jgi:polyisoprenoid-binding protein YceI
MVRAATFDFDDPKGVNSAAFVLDSPLEPIMGVVQGLTGIVEFDPADPGATTGSFHIAASEIETANDRMTGVLHSDKYLDVETYPDVTFELTDVRDVHEVGDNVWRGTAEGSLTLHGVTKAVRTLVDVTWLPDAAGQRLAKSEGDLLVLRSMFSIDRNDFGIGPNASAMKVANVIEIRLAVVGIEK